MKACYERDMHTVYTSVTLVDGTPSLVHLANIMIGNSRNAPDHIGRV